MRRALGLPQVALFEVGRGRFVREVEARGEFKSVDATPVIVPTDTMTAQKIAWLAKDGAPVKAGDPVVLFDPSSMEKDLADGQADRQTAVEKIGKTKADGRKTAQGLTLDRNLAKEELSSSDAFAAKDTQIFSRNEIIESRIDHDLSGTRFEAATNKLDASQKLGEADIALNEIERSKAEIRIRQAEKGLGSLRVLAPHDGLIVLERSWRGTTLSVGETVWPGQKLAEIPDLRSVEAKVYVLEADAGGLKAGASARVAVEGRSGVWYPAKVSRVDAIAKTRDWQVPTRYFETILTLEKTLPETMKPGQQVRAKIALEEVQDAIAIPRGAVFEKDGKRVVYRFEGGRFNPAEVTIGRNSLSHVVIEKGLTPGDRIALRDPTRAASEIFESGKTGGGAESGGKGAS